jgi:TAT (twin-arginine translocation) pathway-exported protein
MNRRSFLKLGAMTAAAVAIPSALVPREPLKCATGAEAYRDMAHSFNSYAMPPCGDSQQWARAVAFDFGHREPWRNGIIFDLHCPPDVIVAIPKGDVARLNAQFQAEFARIEREAWPVRRF